MTRNLIHTAPSPLIRSMATASLLTLLMLIGVGCEGRTLVDDNPVFASAPPRRSLTNTSSVAAANGQPGQNSPDDIQLVSAAGSAQVDWLQGNLVVAEINGKPIFVDDIVGSMRLMVEAAEELSAEQKQQIIRTAVQRNLPDRVEQEIVMAEIGRKIPEDRQEAIEESIEGHFQALIKQIKAERKIESDEQLDNILASEGQSIPLLRESFYRMQMVDGYLFTLAEPPATIARKELVAYYQDHREEFTPEEKVRWQEIAVRFQKHGGREGAEKRMTTIVQQLQRGADFGKTAVAYSDSLSAERQGDMDWLKRGGLADKELETLLFELPVGGMTHVFVRDDRFEVFRVIDHQLPVVAAFKDVQQEIEELLKQKITEEQRNQAIADLKARSTVTTVFDADQVL